MATTRAPVRIGDVAVMVGNDRAAKRALLSRAMDNRVDCDIALEAPRFVAETGGAAGDVAAVAAVQEAITFAGARTTAFSLAPNLAVVVTLPSGPTSRTRARRAHGTSARLRPSLACSTIDPRVFELLYETAEGEGIPFTVASAGGGTGTDAAIHLSRASIPTAPVLVPCTPLSSSASLMTWRTPRSERGVRTAS